MVWSICICSSVLVLLLIPIGTFFLNRNVKVNDFSYMTKVLFIATFISAVIIIFPINAMLYIDDKFGILKVFFVTLQKTLQVFSLDGNYGEFTERVLNGCDVWCAEYLLFGSFIYVLGPCLTLGVIVSFFKNFLSYGKILLGIHKERFVFSELNEKSIHLAESIFEKNEKAILIFTDVFENNEEASFELIQRARNIRAICLKQDILAINFNRKIGSKKVAFFIIGENDSENIEHSMKLIERNKDNNLASLYSFTNSKASELLIGSVVNDIKMKVRRIDDCKSWVYHYLFNMADTPATDIIQNYAIGKLGEKVLSIAIVGFGNFGIELFKAFLWAFHLEGYRVEIHIFDKDRIIREKILAINYEFESFLKNSTEYGYKIYLHEGIDVRLNDFDKIINMYEFSVSYVALGNDELNIETSVKLRTLFRRNKSSNNAKILAVVFDKFLSEKLSKGGLYNLENTPYDIEIIGDLKSRFSYDVIINSDLDNQALVEHCRWAKIDGEKLPKEKLDRLILQYYKYDYFRDSSMSRIVRDRIRNKVNPKMNTKYEHEAWQIYMFLMGYVYSEKKDHMSKQHNKLVDFNELNEKDRRKDMIIHEA